MTIITYDPCPRIYPTRLIPCEWILLKKPRWVTAVVEEWQRFVRSIRPLIHITIHTPIMATLVSYPEGRLVLFSIHFIHSLTRLILRAGYHPPHPHNTMEYSQDDPLQVTPIPRASFDDDEPVASRSSYYHDFNPTYYSRYA